MYFQKWGLLCWLGGKESVCQWRRCGFDPWVGKIPWRRKWQPTPVFFLPGESHGWRSLVGYSPPGRKEWDTTEELHFHFLKLIKFLKGIFSLQKKWAEITDSSSILNLLPSHSFLLFSFIYYHPALVCFTLQLMNEWYIIVNENSKCLLRFIFCVVHSMVFKLSDDNIGWR